MAEQDNVGAAVKAGLVLALALAMPAMLPGAFLFALGNMAFNDQWLSLLALGSACMALLIMGTVAALVAGWDRARPYLRPAATGMVITVVAVSCALTPWN